MAASFTKQANVDSFNIAMKCILILSGQICNSTIVFLMIIDSSDASGPRKPMGLTQFNN